MSWALDDIGKAVRKLRKQNDRLRMAAFDRAIGVKKMNKQYIGVKFLNNGHYCPMANGIVYHYFNEPDISGDEVQCGDLVVAETRYGPAVARVVIIVEHCSASCQILAICQGPWADEQVEKYLTEEHKNDLRAKKRELKEHIKKIVKPYSSEDPIQLAKVLTGLATIDHCQLTRLLKELAEIEECLK